MRTIYSIQSLRAVAAIAVVIVHVSFEVGEYTNNPRIGNAGAIGQIGVDIFFVISGFIMFMMTTEREMTPTEFLFDRFTRIWPLYALGTFGLLFLAFAGRSMPPPPTMDLVKSLLFIPYDNKGAIRPFLNVGWTLNYEMFFYVLFAVSMLLGRLRVVGLAAVLISLALIGAVLTPENPILKTCTSPMLIEFLCGIGVGILWRSNLKLPMWPGICLALAGIIGAWWLWHPESGNLERLIYAGFPSAVIVAGALSMEGASASKTDIGVLLGAASYSIYLTHPLTLLILGRVWKTIGVPDATTLMVVSIFVSVVAGIGFHFLAERPLTAFIRLFAFKRRRAIEIG